MRRRILLSMVGVTTVAVVLFLCALAVAVAIQTILDLSRPFEGVVRVSGQPIRHALEVISH